MFGKVNPFLAQSHITHDSELHVACQAWYHYIYIYIWGIGGGGGGGWETQKGGRERRRYVSKDIFL